MLSPVKVVGLLVIVAIGLLALFGASRIGDINPFAQKPYTDIGPTVVESVRDLSQLTTVEQVQYTTVDRGKSGGLLGFLRSDRIFLFAVARIGAGVDLSELEQGDFEVDREQRKVRLTIPAPTIQYVAMDSDATRIYDRDTGLFTKGDKDLESEARKIAEGELRQKALTSGILERAHTNTVRALTAFLGSLGYDQVEIVQRGD
ncbi:MAG: DUF4230 domain-containing protein [Chloroflexi bacterium]|nr:MAG: DUF4230 domain-containing protein [Chloroflexota bacterium]